MAMVPSIHEALPGRPSRAGGNPVHYFDCFRFVFCLSLMEADGYVVSSGTDVQARFALVASRIRRPIVREYRIRIVFAGYVRRPRGVVEP